MIANHRRQSSTPTIDIDGQNQSKPTNNLNTGDSRKMTTQADANETEAVYWPRVKELLDTIMERWIERHGRQPYPGIHEYWWETPEDLANSVLNGYPSIEPGLPGAETHLVRSLRLGCGTFGRMPLRGPFLSRTEAAEIASWIDAGMPVGPEG